MNTFRTARNPLLAALLFSGCLVWSAAGLAMEEDSMAHDEGSMSQDSGMTHDDMGSYEIMSHDGMAADPGASGEQSDTYQAPLDGDEPMAGDDDSMSDESGMSSEDSMKEDDM